MCSTAESRFGSSAADPNIAGDDLFARESSEGERAHEFLRRGGHDYLHTDATVLEVSNDFGGFVGGDTAANT